MYGHHYQRPVWLLHSTEIPKELVVLAEEDQLEQEICGIYMGSLSSCVETRKWLRWIPGVYCNLDALRCTNYYALYEREDMLNDDYLFLPKSVLLSKKEWLFKHLASPQGLFIRPDSGFKTFTGFTVGYDNFEKELSYLPEGNDLCLLSSAKAIHEEYRLVMVGGVPVAGSLYMVDGEVERGPCPPEVFDFARNRYSPERVYTLDICRTDDELKILEANCFSAAGLYLADREAIVNAVEQEAMNEWSEYL